MLGVLLVSLHERRCEPATIHVLGSSPICWRMVVGN